MKLRLFRIGSLLPLAALLCAQPGMAAEEKSAADENKSSKPQAGALSEEEMMKRWQAYATPGPAHKVLDPLVGEWTVEAKYWMAGPDGPASESKGIAKVHWVFGGRYLQEEFSGEMMQRPFQGMGFTAYDNFKKKYLSTWIDTMGTGIFTSEGSVDDSGKVLTFLGKMDEPTTGEKDKPTKYIVHIVSSDKHTFEMHDLSLGAKSKVFEMTYTRKQ